MDNKRQIFSRLRVLYFIKQDGRNQHRIHPITSRFPLNHGLKFLKAIDRLRSQRLELVHTPGEQLSKLRLWSMHTKTTLQQQKFFWAEDTRIYLKGLRLDLSIDQGHLCGAAKVNNRQTDEAQNSRYGNKLTSKNTHKKLATFPTRE